MGGLKTELLDFYNSSIIDYKIENAGQEWFDGLDVSDIFINIDKDGNFMASVIIHDYLQNDFGFCLEIKNRLFAKIEYNPEL